MPDKDVITPKEIVVYTEKPKQVWQPKAKWVPPNRTGERKFDIDVMIAAIYQAHGKIFGAARLIGCSHNTIREYAKQYPEVQEAIEAARGARVDVAEDKLAEAVDRSEPWAIALTLKTVGKDRGYTEKIDIGGVKERPQIKFQWSDDGDNSGHGE